MPGFRFNPALSALMLGAAALVSTPILSACQPASALSTADPERFTENLRGRFSYDGVVERFSLEERMAHFGVPGVAVAVIEDGELLYAQGFGVLQAGSDGPVTADTVLLGVSGAKLLLPLKPALVTIPIPLDGVALGLEPALVVGQIFFDAR